MPIKQLLTRGLRHQVNWFFGFAFCGYGKDAIKIKCPCPEKATICQNHIASCNHWDPILRDAATRLQSTKEDILEEIDQLEPDNVDRYIEITVVLNNYVSKQIKRLSTQISQSNG